MKEDKNLSKYIKKKINVNNVNTFYKVAKTNNLSSLAESSLKYIEHQFPMVVKKQNFLNSDFSFVSKILGSSELNIHSEVEVFIAASAWLKHNSAERSKFAKRLLLKIRLALLSEPALTYLLGCDSPFTQINECVKVLKEALCCKKHLAQNNAGNCCTRRYCTQNEFNLLICGGINSRLRAEECKVVRSTKKIEGGNFKKVKALAPMNKGRCSFEAVCLKGDVYVFGGRNNDYNFVKTVEKYSLSANKWSVVARLPDGRDKFCACAFMDKIFIIGAYYEENNHETTASCLQFDTTQKTWTGDSWKEVCGMNGARHYAACAVFRGSVVAAGGINYRRLNTVESYDVFGDSWTPMPGMITGKCYHTLVAAKDKLFVVDCGNCEVFDNVCKRFVAFKSPYNIQINQAVSVGNKIVIIKVTNSHEYLSVCYDLDKDEWSEESCVVADDFDCFSTVKLPMC